LRITIAAAPKTEQADGTEEEPVRKTRRKTSQEVSES
jgi:hypothetical protein